MTLKMIYEKFPKIVMPSLSLLGSSEVLSQKFSIFGKLIQNLRWLTVGELRELLGQSQLQTFFTLQIVQ